MQLTRYQKILVGLLAIGLSTGAMQAADGDMDPSFNPNANLYVISTAVQPNGKLVVGGLFTSLGGTPRNHIARLNTDGSLRRRARPTIALV